MLILLLIGIILWLLKLIYDHHYDYMMSANTRKFKRIKLNNINFKNGDIVFFTYMKHPLYSSIIYKSLFHNIAIINNNKLVFQNYALPINSIIDFIGQVYIMPIKKARQLIPTIKIEPEYNPVNMCSRKIYHHSEFKKLLAFEYISLILKLASITDKPYQQNPINVPKTIIELENGNEYAEIMEILK